MKKFVFWMLLLAFLLSACSLLDTLFSTEKENRLISGKKGDLKEEQVLDAAWDALEPNTSSHDRGNWDVVEVGQVTGKQVAERFEGEPAPGCWSGPEPPGNDEIQAGKTYWYVQMRPKPVTPVPQEGTPSPTAPPLIPEPFLRDAHFLIDPQGGEIVARKLICVIY